MIANHPNSHLMSWTSFFGLVSESNKLFFIQIAKQKQNLILFFCLVKIDVDSPFHLIPSWQNEMATCPPKRWSRMRASIARNRRGLFPPNAGDRRTAHACALNQRRICSAAGVTIRSALLRHATPDDRRDCHGFGTGIKSSLRVSIKCYDNSLQRQLIYHKAS